MYLIKVKNILRVIIYVYNNDIYYLKIIGMMFNNNKFFLKIIK